MDESSEDHRRTNRKCSKRKGWFSMPRKKEVPVEKILSNLPPAMSDEARENQLISLAMDLAEKQLREGTASSQVISILLKRGSPKEKLEQEILEKQKSLLEAKTKAIESAETSERLYAEAIAAMRMYGGGNGSL